MTMTPDVTESVAIARTAKQRTPTGRSFGPLLLRLHFYAGILVAPFLLVAGITGLLFTAAPTLDKIVYGAELVVDDPGDTTLPVTEQVAAARASHPDGDLVGVRVGEHDATTQVDFTAPALDADLELAHTVYVDPYTAKVTGQLTTWWGSTPLTTWLDQFHRDLHLGKTGELYSELAASWLWVLALGGALLWWRRHRGNRAARRLLAPDLAAKKGVRRTRSWHGSLGLWLLVGLLGLSATGLTWSGYAGANFSTALDALKGNRPYVATELTAEPPAAGGHHNGAPSGTGVDPAAIDTVLAGARQNGLDGPVQISPPEEAGNAWTVTQNDNVVPTRLDSVAVDGTGKVLDRVDFTDWPLPAKLTSWGVQAHMGILFGVVNQIVLAALAIGLITVVGWGYRMWWQRRPTRADRSAPLGAPPARSAWQQLPTWGIVVGVPLVFAVAWVLPLLGIPLLAFLAIDLVVGAARKNKTQPKAHVSPAPAGS